MQTHGGHPASEAITARERHFTARLLVDWNRDGKFDHPLSDLSRFASRITTDRALKGSAPEEITLIEGASAAELTATLSGWHDGLSLVEVFAPYNGKSPFYDRDIIGAEVTYAIELHTAYGTVTYPQFTGLIRVLDPDRGANTVELECLDRVEMLRRPVRFPKWALSQYWEERGRKRAQLTDSQWIIDTCLRQCDVSPTPYRPTLKSELGLGPDALDGVHLWVSGTGSHLPTVGWLDNSTAQTFPHTEATGVEMFDLGGDVHPASPEPDTRPLCLTGLADSPDVTLKYWASDRDLMNAGGTHYAGFTLVTDSTPGGSYYQRADTTVLSIRIGSQREMRVRLRNGQVWGELVYLPDRTVFASNPVAVPSGQPSVPVTVILDHTTRTGCRLWVKAGANALPAYQTVAAPYDGRDLDDEVKGLITVNRRVKLQDLCYATRNIYGPNTDTSSLRRNAAYPAVLDSGRNRLTYLPANLQGRDAWDVITGVAGAEFGSVFWDESGVFHFWNYDTILAHQQDTVRVLSLDDVEGLKARRWLDSVRNIWSVECGRKTASYGIVYESRSVDEFYVPGGTSKVFRIWVGDVLCADPWRIPKHTSWQSGFPQWNDGVLSGYCVQYLINGVWQESEYRIEDGPTCYFDVEGYLVVNVYNGWDEPVRFAMNGDRPAFRVSGTRILDADPLVFTTQYQDSINTYGGRNIRLSGDWYQDEFQSRTMLAALAARTTKPIPATEAITIAGDPRLQLGDTIEIADPHGMGEQFRLQVFGIRRTFDVDNGLTDELTVEILEPPGAGVWDSEQYGIWDDTFTWS